MENQEQGKQIAYNGECAFALSTGKKGVPGKDSIKMEKDGKIYYFSNPVAKFLFNLLPGRKEKADTTFNS